MVDLLVCLALFTAWQMLLPPVSGRVAFTQPWRRVHVKRGTRWTWLPWWPPAPGTVAAGRAIELRGEGLAPRFPRPEELRTPISAEELARVRVRGRSVRVGRRVVCRCVTRRHAERVAALLRQLAPLAASARAEVLAELARTGLDEEAFAELLQRSGRPLRLLAGFSAASVVAALGVGVAAALSRFEEGLLLVSLPLLGLVHAAGVAALFRAHRAADPDDAAGRLEAVFSALFFPPAAWISAQHLRCELASRFHPALAAGLLLDREGLLDLLRAESALLARAAQSEDTHPAECQLLAAERKALQDFAAAHGLSPAELAEPRAQCDGNAASYCVVCGSDYRPGFDWCRDCAVPTLAYAPLRTPR